MKPDTQSIAAAPPRGPVTLDAIGRLATFLAGPASSGITGQTIDLDGGQHAASASFMPHVAADTRE